MKIELLIGDETGSKVFEPVVEDGVEWSVERRGSPGKLSFKVLNDNILDISEGSPVRLCVNGKQIFYGFVFTQKRDKNQRIDVTAFDQLRYLQNKDTYVYENKTATQFIDMVAKDFNLNVGTLEDTNFVIPSRVEDNTSLFDMIENALDLTLGNKKEMFVLYDDFGKVTLKNISNMYIGNKSKSEYLMIDEQTAENYEYTSSIDSETYNKIKLIYDNEETKNREVYITQHGKNINRWGILQFFETLQKGENGQSKADALLSLYNQKTRNLQINKAFGDVRVRAGSMIVVNLNLGDMKIKNFMMVEKVKHVFNANEHTMDLTLRGGEFVA